MATGLDEETCRRVNLGYLDHRTFEIRDMCRFNEVVRIERHHGVVSIPRISIPLLKRCDSFLHDLKIRLFTGFRIEHFVSRFARVGIDRVRIEIEVGQCFRVATALALTYPG